MEFNVDKPYPPVRVEGKNLYYANLLLEDYAGMTGELTAITEYVYQKFDKFQEKSEFSHILGKIAIVEMKHLELLGETIKLLGVNPKYCFKKDNYYELWNSSFVNFNDNVIDMLKSDIKKEEDAIKNYELHISMIDDKYIREMLYRIIEDERVHIKCFNYLLNKELGY